VEARGLERRGRQVQRLMEVVRRRGAVAVRPQELAGPLAVEAVVGREREQLDEALGLAQPPRPLADDLLVCSRRETTEQRDPNQRAHRVSPSLNRAGGEKQAAI